MTRVRVTSGARLHFGFCNLSLAHERLYGSLGVALAEPRVVVEAAPAERVECDHDRAGTYARRVASMLDVPGVAVTVHEAIPPHTGLGSGTQLALSVLAAVGGAHDQDPAVWERAPALGRGGRSGVGVATFREGGFVLDAGHPTERFTTARPAAGTWRVPPVVARHPVPDDWRFVLVVPDVPPGPSDEEEDASIRAAVEAADPAVADRVGGLVLRRVLPAVVEGDGRTFGAAVAEVGRLNGAWYADEQGGVYRPPVGALVDVLRDSPAVAGAGQSSWGPTVYGVTDADHLAEAREVAERALDVVGVDGTVRAVRARNVGADTERIGPRNA